MSEHIDIAELGHLIEAAFGPENFLNWLDAKLANDEYTGIAYAVYEAVFNSDFDELDDDEIIASKCNTNLSGAEVDIVSSGEFLMLMDFDSRQILEKWRLPQWAIDLDSLAVFQCEVNQQPLLFWQIRQYLLHRWGLHQLSPVPEIEYWDY